MEKAFLRGESYKIPKLFLGVISPIPEE